MMHYSYEDAGYMKSDLYKVGPTILRVIPVTNEIRWVKDDAATQW